MTTKTTPVKRTQMWFTEAGLDDIVFRIDTHRVTFHNEYVAVSIIDKYGDERARTWYPWHTIRRVEETWLTSDGDDSGNELAPARHVGGLPAWQRDDPSP